MHFIAYLGWSLKHVAQNYLFILISFIAILCANMSRVNKALSVYTVSKVFCCVYLTARVQGYRPGR
jgi:hypothetical protein